MFLYIVTGLTELPSSITTHLDGPRYRVTFGPWRINQWLLSTLLVIAHIIGRCSSSESCVTSEFLLILFFFSYLPAFFFRFSLSFSLRLKSGYHHDSVSARHILFVNGMFSKVGSSSFTSSSMFLSVYMSLESASGTWCAPGKVYL